MRVAQLYHPNVRPRLGNFDNKGADLATVLDGYFSGGFSAGGGAKSVMAIESSLAGAKNDEVRVMFQQGQSGEVVDIRRGGSIDYEQNANDTSEVRCGSVFYLPGAQSMGFWAAHTPHNRKAKSLIAAELERLFHEQFPDFRLEISPCVLGSAIDEAVKKGAIEKVTLTRLDHASDRRDALTDDWIRHELPAHVQVAIWAGEGRRLLAGRIQRFMLKHDAAAFGEIVEFNGVHFDTAKVEIELPNGKKRIVNIEKPDGGAAFSLELDKLPVTSRGEPQSEGLFAALRKSIDEMEAK